MRTNAIAGVNDVPVNRRDTPATASNATATIESSHFTPPQDRFVVGKRHPPNQVKSDFAAKYPDRACSYRASTEAARAASTRWKSSHSSATEREATLC